MGSIQLQEFLYTNAPTLPAFEAKAAHMRCTYKCFTAAPVSKEPPKWSRARARPPQPIVEEKRPVKFIISTTDEGLARKEFLPLMNKLTLKNKVSIFNQVRRCIKPTAIKTYVDIIWETCLNCPDYQSLYLEVLELVGTLGQDQIRDNLHDRLHAVFDNSEYLIPADTAADTATAEEAYDEFCLGVKLKKRALGTVSLLLLLEKKGLLDAASTHALSTKLIEASTRYLEQEQYTQVDPLLEQLLVLYTNWLVTGSAYADEITEFMRYWLERVEKMKPSTKFKFYSFAEVLERNSRSVNRWTSKTRSFASSK